MKNRRIQPLRGAGWRHCGALAVAAFLCWQIPQTVRADAAGDLFNEGTGALDRSEYAAAVEIFGRLLENYSSSLSAYPAQVRLGLSHLMAGQYADAIKVLQKVVGDPKTPEAYADAKREACLYLAQSYQRQAFAREEGQTSTDHLDAIKAFDAFFKGKDDHPLRDEALYGRALSYLMEGKFGDAIRDLELYLKEFPTSEGKFDTLYLLANTHARRAAVAIEAGKTQEVPAAVAAARSCFEQILREASDRPALLNEAKYQFGELLVTTGSYEEAILKFRQVAPKNIVVQQQKDRIQKVAERMKSAAGSISRTGFEVLLREKRREELKLQTAENGPEMVVNALSKAALCLVQLGRYDEARVVGRHILPFATDEQKRFIRYTRMLSFGLQGRLKETQDAFDAFRLDYGADKMADNIGLLLGNLYLAKNQPREALQQFELSLKDYPAGRVAPEVMMFSGSAKAQLGDIEGARKLFNDYIKARPKSAEADIARLRREMLLVQEKKWDAAVKALRALASEARIPAVINEAAFRAGEALMQAGQWEDAAKELVAYEKNAPGTDFAPGSLFLGAQCYEKAGLLEPAIQAYRAVVERYAKDPAAPHAQRAIGLALAAAKPPRTEEAMKAFQTLAEQFADTEIGPTGWFYRASLQSQAGRMKDALATYDELVKRHPQSVYAADARFQAVRLWSEQVKKLGNYAAMEDPQRKEWLAAFDNALKAVEVLLREYPDSLPVSDALSELVRLWGARIKFRIDTVEAGVRFFQAQVAKASSNTGLSARLRFALAGFLFDQNEPRRALELMKEAYTSSDSTRFSRDDLARYGLALLDSDETAAAKKVFERLQKDFSADPYAQSDALFGLGVVALKTGDAPTADTLLAQLPVLYPWSDHVAASAYYRGESLKKNKPEEALKLFSETIAARTRKPIPQIKASAMWASGEIKEKQNQLAQAAGYYEMIDTFVGGLAANEAAKGLLKAGTLFEKANLPEEARRVYQSLAANYPEHPLAPQAKARLEKLPPAPPPKP
jgi:TolA-binding protein